MQNVSENAYQQYIRSRPAASAESNKRVKELNIDVAGILPEFRDKNDAASELILKMKNYRPPGVIIAIMIIKFFIIFFNQFLPFQTVFEIVAKPSSADYKVMKEKRAFHKQNIFDHHRKIEERESQIIKCKF